MDSFSLYLLSKQVEGWGGGGRLRNYQEVIRERGEGMSVLDLDSLDLFSVDVTS